MDQQPDPGHIMQTATAFWPAKILLTAVEFDLFSRLAAGPMDATQLGEALDIHPRARRDFFDALLALGFLERDGDGPAAVYRNTAATALFLDRASPAYVGGMLEMLNNRLYGFWARLGDGLRTGAPQNEVRDTGRPVFEELYADQQRLREFLAAMSGVQMGNFQALAATFDFSAHQRLLDLGGALALLSRVVAAAHPHLSCTSFDLPPVAPHAQAAVDAAGLSDRISIAAGDFFNDALPPADVICMGNILHDWNLEKKQALIAKAYAALPPGGALIAIENVIDDARREHAFGLMMSLNMLIELGDGFDYTGADFGSWCEAAGFSRWEIRPLAGPASAAIAWK